MKDILKAFVPWIIFSILLSHGSQSVTTASGAALLVHLLLNRRLIKKRFIFDVGNLIFFGLILINAFVFKDQLISSNAYLLANISMALIAWISIFMRKPFTSQYAALSLPIELTYSSTFKKVNDVLTLIWCILLTAMLIPAIANKLGIAISADTRVIINIALIAIGIWTTVKFPDWFISRDVEKRFDINIKSIFETVKKSRIKETSFNLGALVSNPKTTTKVLIVGAGPVGLTNALFLQQHGVETVVFEKHSGLSLHPKARHVSARSMEIFRRLGVADQIYQHRLPKSQAWFGWFKSLASGPMAKIVSSDDYEKISPCTPASLAQPYVEKVLLETYLERGGQVLFSHQVKKIAQDDNCVQLSVITPEAKEVIYKGQYCIAADGAKSFIRNEFDIPLHGKAELTANFSVFCEINLDQHIKQEERFGIAYVVAKNGPSPMVLSIDGKHKWVFIFPTLGISTKQAKDIFTDKYCIRKIQSVVGAKDIDVKIISKQAWSLGAQVANQFSVGRTFFAGDSIHQFTPTGGMGMNTGIGDADNLAWKLAYVIQKKVNPKILETYETERLPVILDNLQWSIKNLQRIVNIQKSLDHSDQTDESWVKLTKIQSKHLNKSGIDLGYIYQSDIIGSKPLSQSKQDKDNYQPNLYPGARLPHFNLLKDGNELSSLDLTGPNFLLISCAKNKKLIADINWQSVPTEIVLLGKAKGQYELIKQSLGFNFDDKTVLWVRPDGHIAWTGSVEDVSSLAWIIKLTSNLKEL